MNIGKIIKELRESRNISMNGLAKLCEVSQANLSRIESGQQQPAFDTLERIITALGFTFAEVFSVNKPKLKTDVQNLVAIIYTLTAEQRKALLFFLEEMKK